jgi:hypothetical protein
VLVFHFDRNAKGGMKVVFLRSNQRFFGRELRRRRDPLQEWRGLSGSGSAQTAHARLTPEIPLVRQQHVPGQQAIRNPMGDDGVAERPTAVNSQGENHSGDAPSQPADVQDAK